MNNKNTTYVASFQQHGERHFYKKGSFLFHEGSTEHHFYFIQEGLIKISTQTKKGNEKILTIAYPGEVVGLHGIINNEYLISALAMTNAIVYRIPFEKITALIYEHPEMLSKITDTITQNTKVLLRNLYLDTLNAKQRIAYLVLTYVNDFENDRIALTIADFTKYTALTRVRVYQILKEWEVEGIISIDGKHFYIKRLEYFEKMLENAN